MFHKLFVDGFAKITTAIILVLFATSSYLCVQNKAKEAHLKVAESQLVQQQQANQLLSEQLDKANQQIFDYLKQTKALQQKVLNQLQNKKDKSDEILQILAKNKNWADGVVPGDVSRLFKQADLPNSKAHATALPNGKSMSNAEP